MSEKRFANAPLLYIQQPEIGKADAPMQHHYRTNRKNLTEESTNNDEHGTQKKTRRRLNTFQKELNVEDKLSTNKRQGSTTSNEASKSDKENSSKSKRKRFKEMDIIERIDYFLNPPTFAPKVRCEMKTNEKTYRGFVIGYEENVVSINVANRNNPVKVPLDTIEDVQMLGF